MSTTARLLASGVLLLAAAAPAGAGAPVAEAGGKPGYCPDDEGVTVVVDFTELGGDVVVRCAAGSTGSGIDALEDAGFDVTGTGQWGLAFVCRLEGRPAADEELDVEDDPGYREGCRTTPPTSAFWAYSYADNGEDWTYSSRGARDHQAIEGGFEGWRFVLNHGPTDPAVAPLRPDSDNEEEAGGEESEEPRNEPSKPDEPDKPDRPSQQQQPSGQPEQAERPDEEPSDEPSDEPTDEPSTEPSTEPSLPADKPKPRDDKPKPNQPNKHEKPTKPQKPAKPETEPAELGTTSEGVDITGDLPTESTASADEDATSPVATLVGVGVLALLAIGAGLAAYRRRSHST